jgi:hypothetical protein
MTRTINKLILSTISKTKLVNDFEEKIAKGITFSNL